MIKIYDWNQKIICFLMSAKCQPFSIKNVSLCQKLLVLRLEIIFPNTINCLSQQSVNSINIHNNRAWYGKYKEYSLVRFT